MTSETPSPPPTEPESEPEAVVVLVTFPERAVAGRVARRLVEDGLAACVNLVPAVTSVYAWEGAIHEDTEVLALVKSTRAAVAALETAVVSLHPYTTPEFVVLDALHVEARYLTWLGGSVRVSKPGGAAGVP